MYKKAGNSPRIKKDLANAAGMLIAKTYKNLFRLKYEVKGFESLPPGPKIIAINHTNVTDAIFLPLIFSKMPRLIVQDDLFQVPVLGNILKETGQIPVDSANRHKAFEQAYELLLQGETILIFPEGRLVPFGDRVKARTGTVRLSLATGAPVIPLGIYADPQNVTSLEIYRKGQVRKGLYQFRGNCHLRFGASWRPNPLQQKPFQIHAQTNELMDYIYSLVAEAQQESQCVSHTLLSPIPQW
jgi:1-acyl-sn-glycerol-3-phosphate acyltransferase